MLTESLLVSVATRFPGTSTAHARDASIFQYQLHPHPAAQSAFKKSTTAQNCLAISASHIFAAQADKAAVHVFARESGQLQTVVPFRERITALALTDDGFTLVCGTEGGGLLVWETLSGRVVQTDEAHLGPVTGLVVDRLGFALSAAEDGAVHVWNLNVLLAFGEVGKSLQGARRGPIRTLRALKDAVVAIGLGGGKWKNFAVAAGKDGTVVLWDYHEGVELRTILLHAPCTALVMDPCDRAVVFGFADGSVSLLDLYGMDADAARTNPVWDEEKRAVIVQLGEDKKWTPPTEDVGAVLCMGISYDSTKLVTGHATGKVMVWDIPSGRYMSQLTTNSLPGPVSNISMVKVTGLPEISPPTLRIKEVVKPRFGELDTSDGQIPANYKFTAQLMGDVSINGEDDPLAEFDQILNHPSFPEAFLAKSINEMETWTARSAPVAEEAAVDTVASQADFMALDGPVDTSGELSQENADLKKQIAALQKIQKTSFAQMETLRKERDVLRRSVKTTRT